ncbi:MAG: hypothetical protein QOJ09_1990 [Actinomycetota bacterium]|nr:hypothetical protein [Actinomycetota bacterium]
MADHLDVLGAPERVRRQPLDRTRVQIFVTGVTALSVLLSGVAYAGYSALAPQGHSPEQVLPLGTAAFAKVDLDPSATQKIAVYRLSKRFPKTHVKSDHSVKDDLLADVFKAAGQEVDYRRDIKPWIGDRAAIGVVPGAAGDSPHPLVAVEFKDKNAATKGVQHLRDVNSANDLFYAFSDVDDYVLLSDTQEAVDAAAHATRHLADDGAYRSAIATLRGDQIVTAWADLGKVFSLLPKDALKNNPFFPMDNLKVGGQYVLGAHAENDAIEIDLHQLGATTGIAQLDHLALGTGKGSDLVQGFPSDSVAAVSVTGLGEALASGYTSIRPMIADLGGGDVLSSIAHAGIHLPADIRTVFGTEVAGYVAGTKDDPIAVLHVKNDHPAAAKAVLQKVVGLVDQWSGQPTAPGSLDSVFKTVPDGFVVGVPEEALTAKATKQLGSSNVFRNAVPDAHGAPVVVFVDLAALQSRYDLGAGADLAKLQAFGATTRSDGKNSVTRLRLTFR